MPFKSDKQRKLMWAKHPAIARRWTRKYGSVPVNQGAGIGQIANQARQKSKPVVSKAEIPTPLPQPKPRPVTPLPQQRPRPVTPLPQPKPRIKPVE